MSKNKAVRYYRRKPISIEAYQTEEELDIKMHANKGDFIITEASGENYPCKRDVFFKTYEEIETCFMIPEFLMNSLIEIPEEVKMPIVTILLKNFVMSEIIRCPNHPYVEFEIEDKGEYGIRAVAKNEYTRKQFGGHFGIYELEEVYFAVYED